MRALRRPLPILEGAASRRTRARESLNRTLLVASDLVAVALALTVVTSVAGTTLTPVTLFVLPFVVLVAKLVGLYDRDELTLSRSTLDELPRLFKLAATVTFCVWLLQDVVTDAGIRRETVFGLWGSALVFAAVLRTLTRRIGRRLVPAERCLVLGDPAACTHMRQKIDSSRAHAHVVAEIGLHASPHSWHMTDEQMTDGQMTDELFTDTVQACAIDRVLIAPVGTDAADTHRMIRLAKAAGVRVSVLPRGLEATGSAVEFDSVDGMQLLGVRRFGLSRSARFVKRSFDILGAGFLLTAVAPLTAAIVVMVKLDTRGPALFRQTRVGRDGRRFEILKFRSMVSDAETLKASLRDRNEAHGVFKIADDPRITRAGAVLRKTSLDELPQLLNVLWGEMSLVGPRPLVVDEDQKVVGLDRSRLHLTPGMTGPWQVLGSSRIPMHEMIGIDYLYVANWSLWNDVKIILRTIPHVLSRSGL
ncbi:MAG: sugar transferase [Solirubrobacterales bacterium]|nr:sugar transferase [Solirubrobacterales bacterium]